MSIYASSSSWGCSSANQSPINLSQSSAKPCDLLCELVMDQVQVPQATVMISDEGLILQNTAGLGSCKYNGEGYTCDMVLVNHPSHHTIENIQADAEVIAIFTNPSGKYLCVSSLVRVNSSQSTSTQFFNKFVPFANPTEPQMQVNLGDDWGLNMMIPPNGAYFVYDGSMVVPNCQSAKWVVFKSMINIDSNDFALLVKNVSPGSRPVQALGDREVFFNDTEQLAGSPMPQDGKTYMRCRRLGKSRPEVKDVQPAGVKEAKDKKESEKPHPAVKWAQDQLAANGLIEIINFVLMVCALGFGFYYGKDLEYRFVGKKLYTISFDLAAWIRGLLDSYILRFFTKPTPPPVITSASV
jgi:carbonic anhydrase